MYAKSIPTVVFLDPSYEDCRSSDSEDDDREGDQVWKDMEHAQDDRDDNGEGEEHTDDEVSTSSLHKKSRTR